MTKALAKLKAVPSSPSARRAAIVDGWGNVLTGLGQAGVDKRLGAVASFPGVLQETEVEHLYGADELAAKIVDEPVKDALRRWVTWKLGDPELEAKVEESFDDENLDFAGALRKAGMWGRLYGGAVILMNVDDGLDRWRPLDLARVRSLKSLVVLNRWEFVPERYETDIDSRDYGMPATYRIQARGVGSKGLGELVHRTRICRFGGAPLGLRLAQMNHMWDDSILGRLLNRLRNYGISQDGVARILQDYNQPAYKMKGLADLIAGGAEGERAVVSRLQTIELARSLCRALILDADEEEFTNISASLSNLDKIAEIPGDALVAGSNMPHTKLLGRSPSGLGATGRSEEKNWDDFVEGFQEDTFRKPIKRILRVLLASRKGPTGGKIPPKAGFEFNPLRTPTDAEQAETRLKNAQADKIEIETGVLDPTEVRTSRYGTGKYSTQITLDDKAGKELAKVRGTEKKPDEEGDDE